MPSYSGCNAVVRIFTILKTFQRSVKRAELKFVPWSECNIIGSSRESICNPVRGSFAIMDFEIMVLKSLDPASYLALTFSKIQKPSKGSMISPEKKFSSLDIVMEMLYRFRNG
ncbi:hypothetical protein AVEN_234110-1 [Araneus ventricosus]|uniref:Uncharacterized protein n=1 Tax=Araneus ventricosus TaxID=182803 RepID=A0A4Y2GNF6_ARAVE|nr:hypothetical protein AVEN_234110-1 [Araneus ventricosus]